MKLNRSRNYGTIAGDVDGFPGAAYTQGGKYFNVNGDEIQAGGKVVKEPAGKGGAEDPVPRRQEDPAKLTEGQSSSSQSVAGSMSEEKMMDLLDKSVNEIRAVIPYLDVDTIKTLHRLEVNGGNRKGLVEALEAAQK